MAKELVGLEGLDKPSDDELNPGMATEYPVGNNEVSTVESIAWAVRAMGGDPAPCPSTFARGVLTIIKADQAACRAAVDLLLKVEQKRAEDAQKADDDRKLIELLAEVRRTHVEAQRTENRLN